MITFNTACRNQGTSETFKIEKKMTSNMCVFVCVYKVDKRDYYYIYISYSAVHISNDYIEWHEVLSLLQI